jgi:hypothetical protein
VSASRRAPELERATTGRFCRAVGVAGTRAFRGDAGDAYATLGSDMARGPLRCTSASSACVVPLTAGACFLALLVRGENLVCRLVLSRLRRTKLIGDGGILALQSCKAREGALCWLSSSLRFVLRRYSCTQTELDVLQFLRQRSNVGAGALVLFVRRAESHHRKGVHAISAVGLAVARCDSFSVSESC